MSHWKALTAAGCALLLAPEAAGAATAVRSPCNPEGRKPVIVAGERHRLILATSQLRVFEVIDPADIAGGRATYACLVRSGLRPASLGSARTGGPSLRNKRNFGLQAAGRFAGYHLTLLGADRLAAGPAIRIVDVRRRTFRTFLGVTDFALRRDGTFDAIVRAGPYPATSKAEEEGLAPGAGPFEVRRYDRVRDRTSVRLDAGEGIDPLSMTGDERRTYWLRAGVPMSASR